MAAPVEIQLRNAQSSILFMQQEHAHTLQSLHQELQKLQKKCAELTFELAMKEGAPDEVYYLEQKKVLEAEVNQSKVDKDNLEKELQKKVRRINNLDQQLKIQEKKYLDEIKKYKQTVIQYKTERDQKSEMIAHLTLQLHQFSLGKHKRTASLEEQIKRTASPQPPREPRPNFCRPHKQVTPRSPEQRVVLNKNRSVEALHAVGLVMPIKAMHTVSHVTQNGLTLADLREQYATTYSKPHSHTDTTAGVSAFIVQSEPKDGELEVKPAPTVLPPILSGRRRKSPLNPHYSSPAVLANKDRRLTCRKESRSPEKHTFAVQKVFPGKNSICQLEESKSD